MRALQLPILEWLRALAQGLPRFLVGVASAVAAGLVLLVLEYRTHWLANWRQARRDDVLVDPGLDFAVTSCSVGLEGWLGSSSGEHFFSPKSVLKLVIKLDLSSRHDQATFVELCVDALDTDWRICGYAVLECTGVQVTYEIPGIFKPAGNPLSLAPREIAKHLRIDAGIPLDIPGDRARDLGVLGGLSTMTVVLAGKQAGRNTALCRIPCDVASIYA